MKTYQLYCGVLTLALLTTGSPSLRAEAPKPDAAAQLRSAFIIPTNAREGRDPFFPESTRVFDQMVAASRTNRVVELPPLTVPGISGRPGHLLAIINNHTFAKGDEGDVLTPAGRVHVRCLEVERDHVIVEINGHTHRINLGE